MTTLTEAEKNEITFSGGKPNADWTLIAFNKKEKPNRHIKKILHDNGYIITKKSGRKFESIMEFELKE